MTLKNDVIVSANNFDNPDYITVILNRGNGAGRPEKSDDEKSTKTLQNEQSKS